ncbi:hypothetical protein FQA39_LY10556 [Lamprigera yunnana]|nr:hypothetical protein FQA39_LY10556 [Lamprigera yunnana]
MYHYRFDLIFVQESHVSANLIKPDLIQTIIDDIPNFPTHDSHNAKTKGNKKYSGPELNVCKIFKGTSGNETSWSWVGFLIIPSTLSWVQLGFSKTKKLGFGKEGRRGRGNQEDKKSETDAEAVGDNILYGLHMSKFNKIRSDWEEESLVEVTENDSRGDSVEKEDKKSTKTQGRLEKDKQRAFQIKTGK